MTSSGGHPESFGDALQLLDGGVLLTARNGIQILLSLIAQLLQPLSYPLLTRAYIMAVHGEALPDAGLRTGFPQVLHTTAQPGTFVSGEGDEGLAVQVVLLEEGEHHLRIGAPPDGTANEDYIVLPNIHRALKGRQFPILLFLLGKVAQRLVSHAVVLRGLDFKLVGTRKGRDVVGHNLGIAHLDVAYGIVVASM